MSKQKQLRKDLQRVQEKKQALRKPMTFKGLFPKEKYLTKKLHPDSAIFAKK